MDTPKIDAGPREVVPETPSEPVSPWEEIAPGRYMPRRVRGSCHGRELG